MKRKTAPRATVAEQEYEIVPLDAIQPHPQNVNQGDVGEIILSIEANGFVGACVVQRSTGNILAGTHRWRAARDAGLLTIPVLYADLDDKTSLRYMLADNRLTRMGTDDPIALAELLESIRSDQGTLLGTGFDDEALDDLLAELGSGILESEAASQSTMDAASYQIVIECDSEEQRNELLARLESEGLRCT